MKGHRMPVDGAGDCSDHKALLVGAVTAYLATVRQSSCPIEEGIHKVSISDAMSAGR